MHLGFSIWNWWLYLGREISLIYKLDIYWRKRESAYSSRAFWVITLHWVSFKTSKIKQSQFKILKNIKSVRLEMYFNIYKTQQLSLIVYVTLWWIVVSYIVLHSISLRSLIYSLTYLRYIERSLSSCTYMRVYLSGPCSNDYTLYSASMDLTPHVPWVYSGGPLEP